MDAINVIGVILALVIGCCWWFSRRTLNAKEISAWEWRVKHPVALWLGMVSATCLFLAIAWFGMYISTPRWQRNDPHDWLGHLVTTFLLGAVGTISGSIAFLFWYRNGVSRYKRHLAALQSSAVEPPVVG